VFLISIYPDKLLLGHTIIFFFVISLNIACQCDCDLGPLTEGSEAELDKVRDLYPVVEVETELDEEEEEEENEMIKTESSVIVVASAEDTAVRGTASSVGDAGDELNKDVSEVDLRSVDLQSAFEPELQLISSAEPQPALAVDDAALLTSQTKITEPRPASSQVQNIHCDKIVVHQTHGDNDNNFVNF